MSLIFSDKQERELNAAKCVGLLRTLAEDPCRLRENTQVFFESEYGVLYDTLQRVAFEEKTGAIKWLLLTAMMKQNAKVDVYKSDLGIILQYGDTLTIEVASKIEALTYIDGVKVYEMPSVINEKSGKQPRVATHMIQYVNNSRVSVRIN